MNKELTPCNNIFCIKNCNQVESGCLIDYVDYFSTLEKCMLYTTKKPESPYKKAWEKLRSKTEFHRLGNSSLCWSLQTMRDLEKEHNI